MNDIRIPESPEDRQQRLLDLIKDGLTFQDAVKAFASMRTPEELKIVAWAKEEYYTSEECEVDANALVSMPDDDPAAHAYVLAWVYAPLSEVNRA